MKKKINLIKQLFKIMPKEEEGYYSAIDIGTNACRWCVAKPYFVKRNDGLYQILWRFFDTKSRNVHMGESLMKNNNTFNELSINKSLQAILDYQQQSKKYNIQKSKFVATQACRQSTNGQQLIDLVETETSLKIKIITAQEEAFFALLGNVSTIPVYNHFGVILDIGGGSTEMLFYESHQQVITIHDIMSIPVGVLKMHDDYCNKEEKKYIKEKINILCSLFATRNKMFVITKNTPIVLIGSSGSISNLAYLIHPSKQAAINVKYSFYQGFKILPHLFSKTFHWIENATYKDFLENEFIGSKKSSFILGSTQIIKSVLTHLPVSHVILSKFGVREGVLNSLYYNCNFED